MGLRCHVCDGPVANGRCKYCGMPYRNDEVLYHLNESRTDHYRHATPNARKIMKNQEIPARDRRESLGRTSSREEIRAHQQKVRQDAVKRMTETKPGPSSLAGGKPVGNGKTEKRTEKRIENRIDRKTEETKKRNRTSRFGLLVSVIVVLFGLIPTLGEFFMEHREMMNVTSSNEVYEFAEEINGSGNKSYYVGREYGEVIVGELLEKGTYQVSVESGSAMLTVYGASEARNKTIADSKSSIVLVLSEGDSVLIDPDSEAYRVVFSQLSN